MDLINTWGWSLSHYHPCPKGIGVISKLIHWLWLCISDQSCQCLQLDSHVDDVAICSRWIFLKFFEYVLCHVYSSSSFMVCFFYFLAILQWTKASYQLLRGDLKTFIKLGIIFIRVCSCVWYNTGNINQRVVLCVSIHCPVQYDTILS